MKTEYLLLLQLFFNLVVIAALITLRTPGRAKARKASRRRAAVVSGRKQSAGSTSAARPESAQKAVTNEAPPTPPTPPEGIADLVQEANKRELAAEQALRSRLAHFRARTAQG